MGRTQEQINDTTKQLNSPDEQTRRAQLTKLEDEGDLSLFRAKLIDLTDPLTEQSEKIRKLAFNCIGTDISETGNDSPYSSILASTLTAGIEQDKDVQRAALKAVQCAIEKTRQDDDYKTMLIDTAESTRRPMEVRAEAIETFAFAYRTTDDPDDLQDYGDALLDITRHSKTPLDLMNYVLDSTNNFIREHQDTPDWLETLLIDAAENPNFRTIDREAAIELYAPAIWYAKRDATPLFESLTHTLDVARETNDDIRMQGVETAFNLLRNNTSLIHTEENYKNLASAFRKTSNTDPNRNIKEHAKGCLEALGLPTNAVELQNLRITFHTQGNFPTNTMHKSDAYALFDKNLKSLVKPDEDTITVNGELDGAPVTVRIPKSSVDTVLMAAFNYRDVLLPKALRYEDGTLEGTPAPTQP